MYVSCMYMFVRHFSKNMKSWKMELMWAIRIIHMFNPEIGNIRDSSTMWKVEYIEEEEKDWPLSAGDEEWHSSQGWVTGRVRITLCSKFLQISTHFHQSWIFIETPSCMKSLQKSAYFHLTCCRRDREFFEGSRNVSDFIIWIQFVILCQAVFGQISITSVSPMHRLTCHFQN